MSADQERVVDNESLESNNVFEDESADNGTVCKVEQRKKDEKNEVVARHMDSYVHKDINLSKSVQAEVIRNSVAGNISVPGKSYAEVVNAGISGKKVRIREIPDQMRGDT